MNHTDLPFQQKRQAEPWTWTFAGCIAGIVLSTAIYAPARWLNAGIERATNSHVRLQNVSGTVWSGSGELHLNAGNGARDRTVLPGRVHWKIVPKVPGLELNIAAPCCMQNSRMLHISLTASGVNIAFEDLTDQKKIRLPMAILAGLGTPWNTMLLEGDLALRSQSLTLNWSTSGLQINGEAMADATEVSSSLSTLKPLGSYCLTLRGGADPVIQIMTLNGALKLDGSGGRIDGRWRFSGTAQASARHNAELDNLLNIIGRRDGARAVIQVN